MEGVSQQACTVVLQLVKLQHCRALSLLITNEVIRYARDGQHSFGLMGPDDAAASNTSSCKRTRATTCQDITTEQLDPRGGICIALQHIRRQDLIGVPREVLAQYVQGFYTLSC